MASAEQVNATINKQPPASGEETTAQVNAAPPASDPLPDENISVVPIVDEQDIGETQMDPITIKAEDLARFGDIWERLRAGFKMDLALENSRIDVQRQWYIDHQGYLDRMASRAARYLHFTVSEAEKRGIPTEIALLPVIESSYDPFALSRAQAAGMWQFIPGTGRIFGLKQNWWYDGRRDVVASTRAAYDFLQTLYNKYNDWHLVLAAYNAGPGLVDRAIARNQADGLATDYWSLHLPAETSAYVPRFLAIAQLVHEPERFGVKLQPILNQPYFREIKTPGQVDLGQAAKLAGISLKELYQLNPGFSRWATDPDGPNRLLIPVSSPADYETQLANLPPPERVSVQHYRVKRGDNLFRIAKHFGISPAELKRMNHLRNNHLPLGHELVVAKASRNLEDYTLSEDQRVAKVDQILVADKRKLHIRVRKGETLWAVARHYHVNPKDLARWNGLTPGSKMHNGQKLTVLIDSKVTETASADKSEKTASGNNGMHKIRYAVRRGDTLFSISRKYHVSVKDIRNWNRHHQQIKPGQDLVLYVAANSR